jgi:hypothetical protein
MASTIKLKNGSGAPTTGDLVQGEPALDLTNKRLYTENASGVVIEVGTNPSTIDINAGTIDGTVIGGTTAAAITGTTITGTSFVSSGDMTFEDNDKAVFGDGSDLRIYHTGSHSTIENIGTGHLQIHTTDFRLRNSAGTESMILANADGDVQLYYNNALKLATTATGIDVTGTVTADGLTVDKTATISTSDYYGASTFSGVLKGAATNTKAALLLNSVSSSGQNAFASIHSEPVADFRASLIGTYSADGSGAGYFAINQFLPASSATQERMRIDSSGNVGIGVSTPLGKLHSSSATSGATPSANGNQVVAENSGNAGITIASGATSLGNIFFADSGDNADGYIQYDQGGRSMRFGTATSEAMRLDSSGNLLVGKTATNSATAGAEVRATGALLSAVTSNFCGFFNRISTDGTIIEFAKDDTTVGSIFNSGTTMGVGSLDTGVLLANNIDAILPWNASTNAERDNAIDLGRSGGRFKDLYLSGTAYVDTAVEIHAGNSLKMQNVAGNGFATIQNVGAGTNTDLSFNTASTERMRIDSSGNVGIGSSGALTSTYLSKAFVYTAGGANFALGGLSDTNNAVLSRFTSFNISNSNSGNQDSGNFYGVTSIESIVVTTDSNAGDDSGGSLLFKTKPEAGALAERMRIDSSGNVGIGVTPSLIGSYKVLQIRGGNTSDGGLIKLETSDGTSGAMEIFQSSSVGRVSVVSNLPLAFNTNNTERARFDTSGNLLVGATVNTTNSKLIIGGATRWAVGTQSGGNLFYIVRDSDNVGQYMVNGATSWTATSDERLKDIIEPITDAANKVSTLRAVIGKFKKDAEGTRRSFLIAQDVQAVLPEAVTVQEDEAETLGIQYTEVIPLLVAAIKEQQDMITALTTRIEALEGVN